MALPTPDFSTQEGRAAWWNNPTVQQAYKAGELPENLATEFERTTPEGGFRTPSSFGILKDVIAPAALTIGAAYGGGQLLSALTPTAPAATAISSPGPTLLAQAPAATVTDVTAGLQGGLTEADLAATRAAEAGSAGAGSGVGGASSFGSNLGLTEADLAFTRAAEAGSAGAGSGVGGASSFPTTPPLVTPPRGGGEAAKEPGILDTLKDAATILSPIASLLGAQKGIQDSRSLSNIGTTPPPVPPATPIPLSAGAPIARTMQDSFTEQLRRRGRASTILTDQGEKLGSA